MFSKLLWRILRLTYPWVPLAIHLWQMAIAPDRPWPRAQVRFWRLYSRIDFASLLAIAMDMIQPEYWV